MSTNVLKIFPNFLNREMQNLLVVEIMEIAKQAPLFLPRMPISGNPFTIKMTNAGELGWVADKTGHRYQPYHPVTKRPWPHIPKLLINIWNELTRYPLLPECMLINYYYDINSKLGIHRDEDEVNLQAPILSISLGDDAIFKIGGSKKSDPKKSIKLSSGDIIILSNNSRLAYHGITKIVSGTSTLLKNGGRINLTLRRVNF